MRYSNNEPVELAVETLRETEMAFLVSDGDNESWIPKSQTTVLGVRDGKPSLIEIPEWLAKRAGLI